MRFFVCNVLEEAMTQSNHISLDFIKIFRSFSFSSRSNYQQRQKHKAVDDDYKTTDNIPHSRFSSHGETSERLQM